MVGIIAVSRVIRHHPVSVIPDTHGPGSQAAAVAPPYFGSRKMTARKIHLRLVMQNELTFLERLAQLIFQCQPDSDRFGHFLSVKKITLAAHLGFLERGLGILEQGLSIGAI